MKKLLLIIVLLTSTLWSNAQGRVWKETAKPVRPKTNFIIKKDFLLFKDSTFMWQPNLSTPVTTDSTWVYIAVAPAGRDGYTPIKGVDYFDGQMGLQGIQGVQGVPGNTGAQGIQGIKGDKGDPGQNGTGAFVSCIPQGYNGQTFSQLGLNQSFIDANYAGLGIVTSDTRDYAELVKCIASGKPIDFGSNIGINKGGKIAKTRSSFQLRLNTYKFYTVNNNVFSMLYCDLPVDLDEANAMAARRFKVEGLGIFEGTKNQIGIDFGAGAGHIVRDVEFVGLKTGNHYRFSMQTCDENTRITRCVNGIILDYYRHLPNDAAMSPCHKSVINQMQYWTDEANTTGVGIGVYAADGVFINSPVLQGGNSNSTATINYLIEFDDIGQTTVKNFDVNGLYEEFTGGVTGSTIKLKMRDGVFKLDGAIGHHPSKLVDATQSLSSTNIWIGNVHWYNPKNNKLFDTAVNGAAWHFDNSKFANNNVEVNTINYQTAIPDLFVTPTSIKFCGNSPNQNCGTGCYTIRLAGR